MTAKQLIDSLGQYAKVQLLGRLHHPLVDRESLEAMVKRASDYWPRIVKVEWPYAPKTDHLLIMDEEFEMDLVSYLSVANSAQGVEVDLSGVYIEIGYYGNTYYLVQPATAKEYVNSKL